MTISRSDLMLVTSETIPGREIVQVLGLVTGSTVRAKHIGTDIIAGLRNLVGGEVREYASLLAGSREQAIDRMSDSARLLGANAVVALRMQTSTITQGASEVMVYGTAVRVE